jgi:hypothetical protein
MKEVKCKGCEKLFTKENNKQIFCAIRCSKEYHKKINRVEQKKGRYTLESAERRKPQDIDKELKQEIFNFLNEIRFKKCMFLDAVDSFKMIHYYIELYGLWYFNSISIEEELYFCYRKCYEWMNIEKKNVIRDHIENRERNKLL